MESLGLIYNQFGIIQVLQRSPIPQTSNWSGTFFAVPYSKPALVLNFSLNVEILRVPVSDLVLFLEDGARIKTSS